MPDGIVYKCSVRMPIKELRHICKKMSVVGTDMTISSSEEGVTFRANSIFFFFIFLFFLLLLFFFFIIDGAANFFSTTPKPKVRQAHALSYISAEEILFRPKMWRPR